MVTMYSTLMGQKIRKVSWKSWIRGLNTLQSPVNIRDDELSEALNVIFTDEGQPTRRMGSDTFGDTINANNTPVLIPHYNKNGTNTLMAISNGRGLIRNNLTGAWATVTSAASFPSSSRYNWSMLNNITYIASDAEPLTKFDGTYLTRFATISTPTGLAGARGASLASGQFALSYKITAENSTGETAASSAVVVNVDRKREQWNFDETNPTSNYSVNLTWNAVSGATKYNIYGVQSGNESYIDSVENGGLSYRDYGLRTPSIFFSAPTGNTTDAPRGELISVYKSSIIIAGDPTEPSRLYYSAGVDKPDSFTISDGGGWIDINRNAEDGKIVGIKAYQDSLIVFKEYSIWKFDFTTSVIPSLSSLRQGLGVISQKTILPVENDLFFLGRAIGSAPALYTLGNEPNYLTVLRTNEISARVRPNLTPLIPSGYDKVCAFYIDNRYYLFYPDGTSTYNNLGLVYDRQRLGFSRFEGINVENPIIWRDEDNVSKIIYGDGSDKEVSEFSSSYTSDKGTPISWEIRTKRTRNRDITLMEQTKWVNTVFKFAEGAITFSFYHDDERTDLNYQVTARDRRTAFGYWSFGVGGFGRVGADASGASDLTSKVDFPVHRLGSVSVSNSFGLGISGNSLTSNLTLLNLSIERKEKSKNLRDINNTYQI